MAAPPPHYQHVPHSPPPHPRTSTYTANHDSLTAATATTPAMRPSTDPTDSSTTTTTFTAIPPGGDASPMVLSPPLRPTLQSELAQYRSRTLIAVLALVPTLSLLVAAWFYAIVRAPTVLLQARNVALLQVANVVMVTLERACTCIFPKQSQSHPHSHSSPPSSPLDKQQSTLLPTTSTDGAHMNTSVVGASIRTADTAGVTSLSVPPSAAFTIDDGLDDDDMSPGTRRTASVPGVDVDLRANDDGRACAEKTLPLFVSLSLPASQSPAERNSGAQQCGITSPSPVHVHAASVSAAVAPSQELRSLLIN